MTCVPRNNGAAARGSRRAADSARRGWRLRAGLAALGLVLMAPAGAAADELDTGALRGSLSNAFSSESYVRWDGINFGAHMGLMSMNTDFGNSTHSLVAYILRNTTMESEAAPSNWTALPSNTTNGRSYGAFLGYNVQWDQLVVRVDGAYNRPSTLYS